jgi:hypothetical protein
MAPPQPSIPIITTMASQGNRMAGLPFPHVTASLLRGALPSEAAWVALYV